MRPGRPSFRMVRTTDGGSTWKSADIKASSLEGLKNIIAAPSRLWFSDSRHGWLQWKVKTSSAFSVARLLSTEDGGDTWMELPIPPSAGEFQFSDAQHGWIVGGAASNELWGTHDGGHTWSKVAVPRPASCKNCRPIYSALRSIDTLKRGHCCQILRRQCDEREVCLRNIRYPRWGHLLAD